MTRLCGLRQATTVNTGAYVYYDYGPNHTSRFASINSVAPNYWDSDTFTTQLFDGLGRVFAVASNHPGSTGGNKVQYTRYDQMGRAVQQTNPFEMDSLWQPAGDDVAGTQERGQACDSCDSLVRQALFIVNDTRLRRKVVVLKIARIAGLTPCFIPVIQEGASIILLPLQGLALGVTLSLPGS